MGANVYSYVCLRTGYLKIMLIRLCGCLRMYDCVWIRSNVCVISDESTPIDFYSRKPRMNCQINNTMCLTFQCRIGVMLIFCQIPAIQVLFPSFIDLDFMVILKFVYYRQQNSLYIQVPSEQYFMHLVKPPTWYNWTPPVEFEPI